MIQQDKIICRGLTYECEIGFHKYEKCVKQKIVVDFTAFVLPPKNKNHEDIKSIRLDYFEANRLLIQFFKKKRFKLIETVAHEIARLLLLRFAILEIEVMVTKFPLDMPNAHSISYVCFQKRPV